MKKIIVLVGLLIMVVGCVSQQPVPDLNTQLQIKSFLGQYATEINKGAEKDYGFKVFRYIIYQEDDKIIVVNLTQEYIDHQWSKNISPNMMIDSDIKAFKESLTSFKGHPNFKFKDFFKGLVYLIEDVYYRAIVF